MNQFAKVNLAVRVVIILLAIAIVGVFAADVLYVNNFNKAIYERTGEEGESLTEPYFYIDTRKDNTSTWLKRDFSLNDETVDLSAQIFDGTIYNESDYEMENWSFTLQIKTDCFINQAWNGTVEIHQHVGTEEEKVQTLNLANYDLEEVTLDYLYDGDLLIPVYAGDYIVYHASQDETKGEIPILSTKTVTMGMILYFLEDPDLTDYTLTYQLYMTYTECKFFKMGLILALVMLFVLAIYTVAQVTYHLAMRDSEIQRSSISTMSDIYSIIYIVDLKKKELIPILQHKQSDQITPKKNEATKQLQSLFEWDCKDVYKDMLLKFCDLDTVGERMGSKNTLVCEYISKRHGWCQVRFFAMERNDKGDLRKLVFTIQNIDEEKSELESLQQEVEQKKENIIDIQQKLVVGLANMIENRDVSTGGHVKRTSDVISIIVQEIQKQDKVPIDAVMAGDIVRAAPMHDLGKITIDSSILCKPGKLTDEEFVIMKSHSARSGEMVHILLDGIEEKHFVDTAFNIARHHHERWDGKGYPDKLSGEEIPIEARIMAVADVYDALVSKRCYKEPMSFEKAYSIMMEGMGTQFDPQMKEIVNGCREKLEEYYKKNN